MDAKLALVDSIENIKEKLTSQEYKEILENLAKINVDSETDLQYVRRSETDLQYVRRRQINIDLIPNIEIKYWNGTAIVEKNLRTFETGFFKPIKISLELIAFLGIPGFSQDVFIYRPDIAKCIVQYIKEHNLQKVENKRLIDLTKPGGERLRILLGVPNGAELTFFNIPLYIKKHIINV
jgi:chromatin remodeling complex protein RSC6